MKTRKPEMVPMVEMVSMVRMVRMVTMTAMVRMVRMVAMVDLPVTTLILNPLVHQTDHRLQQTDHPL